MRTPRQHRALLRYFYLLVAILVVSAGVLLSSVVLRQADQVRSRKEVERFHVRTLMLIGEIDDRVTHLIVSFTAKQEAIGVAERDPGEGLALDRRIESAFYSSGRALQAVVDIQRGYDEPPFAEAVARVQNRYHRIGRKIGTQDWQPERFRAELIALGTSLYQLERLHSIAVESELRAISARERRQARLLGASTLVVVLVAGAIVVRLFVMVRARLRESLRTEQALLERERQLQQTQKMEALGTLVGGVAHDFNNILTVILGNAETLLADLKPEDDAEPTLREIEKAGQRAAHMTRQLLTFSRSEIAERRVVDLGPLIASMEPMLRRLIREDVELILETDERPAHADVDPVQIEQLIINLAVNARDAMPEGGRLTVRCEAVDRGPGDPPAGLPAGPYARIRVSDTGCGMSGETLRRVFEPFFTTKEPGRGTGLGLFGAHAIASRGGGQVLVESDVGAGSRFDVYLPRHAAPVGGEPTGTSERARGGTETVLLVEDEELVRRIVATTLQRAGYRVLIAGNGVEALDAYRLQSSSIDVILTDVVMPRMGGRDLIEQALQLEPHVSVVFMSGYSEEGSARVASELHAPLLHKPFTARELLETLRLELDRRRERADRLPGSASPA